MWRKITSHKLKRNDIADIRILSIFCNYIFECKRIGTQSCKFVTNLPYTQYSRCCFVVFMWTF